MNPQTFEDYCYDLDPLDMKLLYMSPTDALNEAKRFSLVDDLTFNGMQQPEEAPTKRIKTDVSVPPDFLAKLKPAKPFPVNKFVKNEMGWDSHNTLWYTRRSLDELL